MSTLSQRIIASACNVDAGIAVVQSNAVLQISADPFSRINRAPLHGNRGFVIRGEEIRSCTPQVIAQFRRRLEPKTPPSSSPKIDPGVSCIERIV
ncbi:hypothetical protein [Yoonia sp. R2-816]|uniref:hypothetical protein n=1 Tax=Yoonia sp. R2-816 TaxID=3342638 RepID=UPI00372D37BE